MQYRMAGGHATYAPAPGGGRTMTSFMPGQILTIPDDATDEIEFYDRWVEDGLAERVDVSPAGPVTGGTASLPGTEADRYGTPVTDEDGEDQEPAGLGVNELPGTEADAVAQTTEVPSKAADAASWLREDGLTVEERRRRVALAERAEADRDQPRSTVSEAIEAARARADADEEEAPPAAAADAGDSGVTPEG